MGFWWEGGEKEKKKKKSHLGIEDWMQPLNKRSLMDRFGQIVSLYFQDSQLADTSD